MLFRSNSTTDNCSLSVVELNSITLATKDDRLYKLDKWAAFFKAGTWKELKAMAATDQYMKAAANTIFELCSDENIRELCRRREEYEAYERHINAEVKKLKLANANLSKKNANLLQANADKDQEIARLKELLARK